MYLSSNSKMPRGVRHIGFDRRGVSLPSSGRSSSTNSRQFAGFEEFVAACASGKFHCEPLQKNGMRPRALDGGGAVSNEAGLL